MNVREIVITHLNAGGFDGLCCEDCGCGINDLFPCDGDVDSTGCVPAILTGDGFIPAEQQTNEEETHL